ncbi:MAG: hypothetical protein WA080_10665 [Sulfuricurvum sp.]
MKKVILSGLVLVGLSSHVYAEDGAVGIAAKVLEGVLKGAVGGAANAMGVGGNGKGIRVTGTEIKNKSTITEAALINSNAGVKISGASTTVEGSKIDNDSFVNKALLYNSNVGVQIGE